MSLSSGNSANNTDVQQKSCKLQKKVYHKSICHKILEVEWPCLKAYYNKLERLITIETVTLTKDSLTPSSKP